MLDISNNFEEVAEGLPLFLMIVENCQQLAVSKKQLVSEIIVLWIGNVNLKSEF